MYCIAQIDNQWTQLILDSGSSGSVITKAFMERLGRKADRPLDINMIGILSERKKPLGEIVDLPITIQNATIPINVAISEATGYDILVGNDWLSKCKATISWEDRELKFKWNNQNFVQPATYWKNEVPIPMPEIQVIEDSDDEFEEEDPQYYQLELKDHKIIAAEDGLMHNNELYNWSYLRWLQT